VDSKRGMAALKPSSQRNICNNNFLSFHFFFTFYALDLFDTVCSSLDGCKEGKKRAIYDRREVFSSTQTIVSLPPGPISPTETSSSLPFCGKAGFFFTVNQETISTKMKFESWRIDQ